MGAGWLVFRDESVRGGRGCKTVRMSCGLFSDYTKIVGMSGGEKCYE